MTATARFASHHAIFRALALVLWALILAVPPAQSQPAPAGTAGSAADSHMVDAFLTVFTGGATGLPGMTQIQQTAIATALLEGDVAEAARNARDYLTSQGITHFAGSSAAAFLTAVDLGQMLGRATHQWMGEARLQAEFDRLGGLSGLAAWPRSYHEAMAEGFLGPVLDTRIRPVALWLRDLDGGADAPLSVAYYENRAYQLLVAMRDLELGYRRFGLQGADRSPDTLAAALDAELAQAAAEALGQREALTWMNEVMRAEFARREAERAAAEAARTLEDAADLDAAKEATAALRDREAALAAAQAAETTAQAALERALAAQPDAALVPPLPEPQPGAVTIDLIRTETLGPDTTEFHIRITHTGATPIPAFRADLSAQRQPPGSGVAWGGGAPQPALAAGQVLEMTLVGTGDIGAVVLHLAAMGETVATRVFPVSHSAPSAATPLAADPGWISLPATFLGESQVLQSTSIPSQSLTGHGTCTAALTISTTGAWHLSHLCAGDAVVVVPTEVPGVQTLALYPYQGIESSYQGRVDPVDGAVHADALQPALLTALRVAGLPAQASSQQTVTVSSESVEIHTTVQTAPANALGISTRSEGSTTLRRAP